MGCQEAELVGGSDCGCEGEGGATRDSQISNLEGWVDGGTIH